MRFGGRSATKKGQRLDEAREGARQEWEQVMALMRARATLLAPPAERSNGRGWTRDEIYDERFDRFPR